MSKSPEWYCLFSVPTTTSNKPLTTTSMPTETPLSTAMHVYTSRYTPTADNKTTNVIYPASTTDLSTASASSTIRGMVSDVTTPTAIDPTTVTHRPTAVTVLSQSQSTAHNLINYTTAPTFKVTSSATATNLPTVTTTPSIAHSTLTHRPAVVTGLSQSQSTAHKSSKYTSASIFKDTSPQLLRIYLQYLPRRY